MPDHAPFTATIGLLLADLIDDRLGTLHLLIPGGNFAKLPVEEHEPPGEIQQPVWAKQADQQAILVCDEHRGPVEAVKVPQGPVGAVGKDGRPVGL